MATLGDALKQGKCWDALPVSDRNKIVGASSLENIAVMTPLKSWADLTDLEREAMLAVDWTRATVRAPERCTVCFNPAESVNADGFCSSCVASDSATHGLDQVPYVEPKFCDTCNQLEANCTCSTVSTPEELLADMCTPFWAKDVIRVALNNDCCDAAGVFEVLAKSFDARARRIAQGGR
jgi:hypothetical protein